MTNKTRRNFLGIITTGIAATAMDLNVLSGEVNSKRDKGAKRRPNMYSVVRVIVKETREYCPFYKPGDTFFIRQQCFDPVTATPKQFCMHSLNDIYETYMKVRKNPVGNKKIIGCMDKGIAQFEIERLSDEEGPGWNRPPIEH